MLRNLKVLGREMSSAEIGRFGCRCGGVACAKILMASGLTHVTVLDSQGIVHTGRSDLNPFKRELAEQTNPEQRSGGLAEALVGADVFLGVSAGLVPEELIATMAPDGIVFALSTPIRDPSRRRETACRDCGHRAQRLRQSDQQRAGLPGVFRARSTPAPAESPRR